MKPAANPSPDDTPGIHFLPRWVTASRSETPDSVAFSSGAALAMLAGVLGGPGDTLPGALLRDRMALEAAVACLKLEGRDENTSAVIVALFRRIVIGNTECFQRVFVVQFMILPRGC